jgi:hypothetical protein
LTLFECRVPYVKISTKLLHVRSRVALRYALQIAKDKSTRVITTQSSQYFSDYTRRQVAEVRSELLRLQLITGRLEYIDPPPYEQLMIPSTLNFNKFTFTEITTLIACFEIIRGKHDAFGFTMTRDELSHRAGISKRRMGEALIALAERHLLRTEDVITNPGTKGAKYKISVTLMDPRPEWTGWDLKSVGLYYRQREDNLPAHSRYDAILNKPAYSPRGHDNWFPHLPEDNVKTLCPFCKDRQMESLRKRRITPQATLTFSSKTSDHWGCARCGKRGDSKYLWARLGKFLDDDGPPRLSAKMDKLPDTAPADWEPEIEPTDDTVEL